MHDSAETAVRRYLAWIDDPTSVVDHAAVAAAEAAFAAASDPMAKLHAAADLEHARVADTDALEDDFVSNAKAYAELEAIPVAAFLAVGVSPDVLARAGFAVPGTRGRRGPAASGAPRTYSTARAPQVPMAQIKAVALQMPRQFTLAQLSERAGGGSPVTVRRAVDELIAEGRVRKQGPDPDHRGRGRAPIRYELT